MPLYRAWRAWSAEWALGVLTRACTMSLCHTGCGDQSTIELLPLFAAVIAAFVEGVAASSGGIQWSNCWSSLRPPLFLLLLPPPSINQVLLRQNIYLSAITQHWAHSYTKVSCLARLWNRKWACKSGSHQMEKTQLRNTNTHTRPPTPTKCNDVRCSGQLAALFVHMHTCICICLHAFTCLCCLLSGPVPRQLRIRRVQRICFYRFIALGYHANIEWQLLGAKQLRT